MILDAVKRSFVSRTTGTWLFRLAFWWALAMGLFIAWCGHRVDGWQLAIVAVVAGGQFCMAATLARLAHKEGLPI